MNLSNLPLSELRTDEDWLTGANDVLGRIEAINTSVSGNRFIVQLHILWRDGNESLAEWPYACHNVKVNVTDNLVNNKPYVDYHVGILNANINYLVKQADGK